MLRTIAIQITEVNKSYSVKGGKVQALKGVTLEIPKGGIFCLLGPNGAGKTTLVKIILGCVLPDSGTVFVNGYDVVREQKRAIENIGVVFENAQNTYGYLTVEENLKYFGYLNKLPDKVLEQRIEDSLSHLDLDQKRKIPANSLSRGMLQKLSIALALLKDPEILLLDEPTLGLDIFSGLRIKEFLKFLVRERGKTIFLTTHQMEIAEELGERFAFIDAGQIIWEGSKASFRNFEFFKRFFTIEAEVNSLSPLELDSIMRCYCLNVEHLDRYWKMICAERNLDTVLGLLKGFNGQIMSVNREETSLQEVFLKVIGDARK